VECAGRGGGGRENSKAQDLFLLISIPQGFLGFAYLLYLSAHFFLVGCYLKGMKPDLPTLI
jgi:hypothetical protein